MPRLIMTKYLIEIYNVSTKKYEFAYETNSLEYAQRMMYKPYYKIATRRLVRVETEIMCTEKADANRNPV